MTRPDIESAVRAVDRHARDRAARHWKAIRKVIVYLKATNDLGVVFRRGGDLNCRCSLMRITPADVTIGGRFRVSRSCSGIQL